MSTSSADNSARPLLSVADFNGDGAVNGSDIKDITSRDRSSQGDEKYHPLYDLNADGKIDRQDINIAVNTEGDEVALLDQQIARATQATMRYYGPQGQENAIKDGFLPFSQEFNGHGIHYLNPDLALQIGNSKKLDIERPVGLNYDAKGNLLAVFYLRIPQTGTPTPENPLANLVVDPADDSPSQVSFDTLSHDDWHNHQSAWIAGLGNLNPDSVYFEEYVPSGAVVSRLQQEQFKVFPESDQYYSPKFWMLHGWFHSLNPDGTFANTHPNVSPYAPEEPSVHGHHEHTPLMVGTDGDDRLDAEAEMGSHHHEGVRINGFGGDDLITGHHGDDLIWGGYGNDILQGDRNLVHGFHNHKHEMHSGHASSDHSTTHEMPEAGNDMLYGGPGNDLLYGQNGNDRLFGGVGKDIIRGGNGDDLLRGGVGADILVGDELFRSDRGKDAFVLAPSEGRDAILDFKIGSDKLVLEGGLTPDALSISQIQWNTSLEFGFEPRLRSLTSHLLPGSNTLIEYDNQPLAILIGVNAADLKVADAFVVA